MNTDNIKNFLAKTGTKAAHQTATLVQEHPLAVASFIGAVYVVGYSRGRDRALCRVLDICSDL